ncbi:hypothetical protein HF324_15295 [Chitinophaga oryzae]|uniref:Uncharacterized protein n=1 Tax=Chitinophaga oryzae TaxID=2725414 RepID=A0ABX6LGC6_9BACT|nr:hypothetical protein [Chitinophaga oryzae]QJB39151.1 hypothetical protein HF324_15295 [Chitinophaga oryzae]
MTSIPPTICPYCGSKELIRTVPEKDPFNVMVICHNCQRVISPDTAGRSGKTTSAVRAIAEKAIQISLSSGKLHGIKYYHTEINKLPDTKNSLQQSKDTVEALLQARGLTSAVKKPSRNGCVIALIIILLIIASVIYFYSQR